MTNKEMIKKLAEMNVLSIVKETDEYIDVEDMASYAGFATIWFDKKGNVERIEK